MPNPNETKTGLAIEIKLWRWRKTGDEPARHSTVQEFYDGSLSEAEAQELYASIKRLADNTLRESAGEPHA